MSMPRRRRSQIKYWLGKLPMMISCEDFEAFIIAYLEDDLPKMKRRVFEFHMKMCPECREYLAAYKRSVELAKSEMEDTQDLPPIPEDLVAAILDAADKK